MTATTQQLQAIDSILSRLTAVDIILSKAVGVSPSAQMNRIEKKLREYLIAKWNALRSLASKKAASMVRAGATPDEVKSAVQVIMERWGDEVKKQYLDDFERIYRLGRESLWSKATRLGAEPIEKGGPGSGNFGHEGRPGEVGGSTSEGSKWTDEHGMPSGVPDNFSYRFTDALDEMTEDGSFEDGVKDTDKILSKNWKNEDEKFTHGWLKGSQGDPKMSQIYDPAGKVLAGTATEKEGELLAERLGVSKEDAEKFVLDKYVATQAALADAGIESVTLYRGVGGIDVDTMRDIVEEAKTKGYVDLNSRTLSSFSTNEKIAAHFGSTYGSGIKIELNVPRTAIFSHYAYSSRMSKYAGGSEQEVVVWAPSNTIRIPADKLTFYNEEGEEDD